MQVYVSVVVAGDKRNVVLALQTYQGVTAHLEAGMELGTVRPVEVVELKKNSPSKICYKKLQCLCNGCGEHGQAPKNSYYKSLFSLLMY